MKGKLSANGDWREGGSGWAVDGLGGRRGDEFVVTHFASSTLCETRYVTIPSMNMLRTVAIRPTCELVCRRRVCGVNEVIVHTLVTGRGGSQRLRLLPSSP